MAAVCAVPSAVYAEAQVDEEAVLGETYETETETESLEDLIRVIMEETATEAETAEELSEESDGSMYSMKEMPFYFYSTDTSLTYPLYFIDDAMDLPYMNLENFADLLVQMYGDDKGSYTLHMEADGPVVEITRENGFSMILDFDEETILFEDYDAFIHGPVDTSLLDVVANLYTDENSDPALIDKINRGSCSFQHKGGLCRKQKQFWFRLCGADTVRIFLYVLRTERHAE